MAYIEVDEINFKETLDAEFEKGQIVILKFGSEYCDGCQALDFELEEIDDKYENISILDIDCGDSDELTQHYKIEKVPHLIIYENKHSTLYDNYGIILAVDIEKIIGL